MCADDATRWPLRRDPRTARSPAAHPANCAAIDATATVRTSLSMRRLSGSTGRDPRCCTGTAEQAAVPRRCRRRSVLNNHGQHADPDWAGSCGPSRTTSPVCPGPRRSWWRLLVTRPLATPLGRRPPGNSQTLEDVPGAAHLRRFNRRRCPAHLPGLFAYLYGTSSPITRSRRATRETDHVLRLGLQRLSITEFPLVRALAPALASYDGAAELDRGPRPPAPQPDRSPHPPDGSPEPSEDTPGDLLPLSFGPSLLDDCSLAMVMPTYRSARRGTRTPWTPEQTSPRSGRRS